MITIRRQLILGLFLAMLLLLGVCGAILYGSVRAALYHDFDVALASKARVLATLVREEERGVFEFELAGELLPEFSRGTKAEYFEIRMADGGVFARSASLGNGELTGPPPMKRDAPEFRAMALPDGRRGRAAILSFRPLKEDANESPEEESTDPQADGSGLFTVVVARGTEEIERLLGVLLVAIGGLGVLLPVAIALTTALVVRRGLRPLDRLADEARSINARTLSRRFPEKGMPGELAPICSRLNELLGRLEDAFARERRFTADAAHELRTPIAELRTLAEVALLDPDVHGPSRRVAREALDIALQMENLVGALLSLARLEAGIQKIVLEPVDLPTAAREVWEPLASRAQERGLSIEWHIDKAPPIQSDRALVRIILGNLFSNAVDYAPTGSSIVCRIEVRDGRTALTLENAAGSLQPEDLPHVFEPFWRKDAARSDSSHSGLGLSLVSASAALLHSEKTATLTRDGQFRIQVVFPNGPNPESQVAPPALQ